MAGRFATYALMYLLRRDEGIESLTYFRLCSTNKKKDPYLAGIHDCLRRWMGRDSFERLCDEIRAVGLRARDSKRTRPVLLERGEYDQVCRVIALRP